MTTGQRVPSRAVGTLHSHLTRLRQALTGVVSIVRQSGCYVLAVDERTVDLHLFHGWRGS